MQDFPEITCSKFDKKVYRNIYTCAPSQDLLDDVCDPEDYDFVDSMVQLSSDIDHMEAQIQRPFQYGCIEDEDVFKVFRKEHWGYSRFSDGRSYGVWYGAEEEMTSIVEASWWAFQLGRDNVLNKSEIYTTDRCMYESQVETNAALDLTQAERYKAQLCDPDDYSYCHRLAHEAIQQGVHMFRTCSARYPRGVCTPIFESAAIKSAEKVYYLRFHISPDGNVAVHSSRKEMNFSFRHPYKEIL